MLTGSGNCKHSKELWFKILCQHITILKYLFLVSIYQHKADAFQIYFFDSSCNVYHTFCKFWFYISLPQASIDLVKLLLISFNYVPLITYTKMWLGEKLGELSRLQTPRWWELADNVVADRLIVQMGGQEEGTGCGSVGLSCKRRRDITPNEDWLSCAAN